MPSLLLLSYYFYMFLPVMTEAFIVVSIFREGNATTVQNLGVSLRQSKHCKYNDYIKHWLVYSKTMGKIEVTLALDRLLIQPFTVQNVL